MALDWSGNRFKIDYRLVLDGTGLALDWPVIDIRLAQERQKIGTGFAELIGSPIVH